MFEKQVNAEFIDGQDPNGEYRVEVSCPYCGSLMFAIHEPEMPVKISAKIVCGHWVNAEGKSWNGKNGRPIKICGKTSRLTFRKGS